MKMSVKLAFDCIKIIDERCGVMLQLHQFEELMNENSWLDESILEYNSAHDTMEREALMDVVARKITGQDWPCNGENRMKDFIKLYKENAPKLGYKLTWI